ncbi:MAG: hypothetical protein IIC35_08070 [Gemmatimonadetes bacterium]|nr:hypothetical protein [Gemmatimonadota bacterium]
MLRFNCFDIERSYIYGPEKANKLCRMDATVDGNPIGWSVKQIRNMLPEMLVASGYDDIAGKVNKQEVEKVLGEVESTARELFATGRNTVKHNRGIDIVEAGNFRLGLELRKQAGGDGGRGRRDPVRSLRCPWRARVRCLLRGRQRPRPNTRPTARG